MTSAARPVRDRAKAQAAEDQILRVSLVPLAATWPIYGDGPRIPAHIGTAVLVCLQGRHFLLTAAHVVEARRTSQLYLGIGNSIVDLRGKAFTSPAPPSGRREDDPLDLAVLIPDTSHWPILPAGAAIGLNSLAPLAPPAARDLHILLGYPCSKQPRSLRGNSFDCAAVTHVGHAAAPAACLAAGYSPEVSLLLDFDKENAFTGQGRIIAADPVGMSGGGIWHCPDLLSAPSPTPRLAAVAVEWHKGRARRILGSRIGPSLGLIAREAPELKPELEAYFG